VSTPDLASPPPRHRRLLFVAAALILIVASVLLLVLLPHRRSSDGEPGVSSNSPASKQSQPATRPSAGDSPIPTSAPDSVMWKLVGQVAVPYSKTEGPTRLSGGTAAGYAHTPVGALIGATQINIRAGYSAGPSIWEPTLQQQFVASADRDALLQLLRQAKTDGQPVAGPGQLAQIAGFHFYSYTPQTATIGLVLRSPSGTYAILTLTVQWRDGDWKMVAPPAGRWPAVTTQPTDLTGVIPWGPI
jgi:hypothetical protein